MYTLHEAPCKLEEDDAVAYALQVGIDAQQVSKGSYAPSGTPRPGAQGFQYELVADLCSS